MIYIYVYVYIIRGSSIFDILHGYRFDSRFLYIKIPWNIGQNMCSGWPFGARRCRVALMHRQNLSQSVPQWVGLIASRVFRWKKIKRRMKC